jgi:sugar lactone lactonase YvrE
MALLSSYSCVSIAPTRHNDICVSFARRMAVKSTRALLSLVLVLLVLTSTASASGANFFNAGAPTNIFSSANSAIKNATGIVVDSSGNVYFADATNGVVYKELYFASNYSEVPIGSGFSSPYGIALDSSGNVYVADVIHKRIVKLTVSGGGSSYTASDVADTTSFAGMGQPYGVAVDSSGNVYFSDATNNKIYKATPAGGGTYTYSTLFSSGLNFPTGVAIDASGNIYIADSSNHRALKETKSGGSYTQTTIGNFSNDMFGISVTSSGAVLVADSDDAKVQYGYYTGSAYEWFDIADNFSAGVTETIGAFMDSSGNIWYSNENYVVEMQTPTINLGTTTVGTAATKLTTQLVFTAAQTFGGVSILSGNTPEFQAALNTSCAGPNTYPAQDLCTVEIQFKPEFPGVRKGAVVFYDSGNNPIYTINLTGIGAEPIVGFPFSDPVTVASGLSSPQQIVGDNQGSIYFVNSGAGTVQKYYGLGCPQFTCFEAPSTPVTGLTNPQGLAMDGAGNLYVSTSTSVLKYSFNGNQYSATYTSPATIATGFTQIQSLAVDAHGNVYVADSSSSSIFEVPWNANNTYGAPVAIASGFTGPGGVAVDSWGDVLVADTAANKLYEILWNGSGFGAKAVIDSSLNAPKGLSIDDNNNVYVADSGNNRVVVVPNTSYGVYGTPYTAITGLSGPAGIFVNSFGYAVVTNATGNTIETFDELTPPTLIFDTTIPGVKSADSPEETTIRNIGNQTLSILAWSNPTNPQLPTGFGFDAANTCPQVAYTAPSPATMAPNASCLLAVDFDPSYGGSFSGNIVITDNDFLSAIWTNSYQQQIPVVATATTPPASLYYESSPAAAILAGGNAGSSITVGELNQYGQPNTNDTSTITLTVTGPGGYSAVYNQAASGVNSAATFNLSSDVLNTPGTYTYVASITAYPSTVTASATEVVIGSVQALPSQAVGGTSTTQSVYVDLPSGGTIGSVLVLTSGNPSGAFANVYTGTCANGHNYSPGAYCSVDVTFAPTYPGPYKGAVELVNNSGTVIGIEYISATGTGPQAGFLPGVASQLTISATSPDGIAVDGSFNAYFTDATTGSLNKLPWIGSSYGPQTLVSSSMSSPQGMAIDGAGNLYVADSSANDIVEYPWTGYSFLPPVPLLSGQLNSPEAVAVDAGGDLFIADMSNNRVVELPWNGSTYGSLVVLDPSETNVQGIAIDSNGNLFYTVWGTGNIVELPYVSGSYGSPKTIDSGYAGAYGITLDSNNNLYASDSNTGNVYSYAWSGSSYGPRTPVPAGSQPLGLAFDPSGNLFVTSGALVITELNRSTPPSLSFATTNVGSTSSDSPQKVTLANLGNLPLSIAVPSSGSNPSIATGFKSDASTTCPTVPSGGTAATLPANSTCILGVDFKPVVGGSISGSEVITDNSLNAAGSTQSIPLSGTAAAPPSVSLSFGASTILPNTSTSLYIILSNSNTSLALTGVGFTLPLPSGLVAGTPSNLSSSCTGTATGAAGSSSVTLTGASLSASSSCEVQLEVTGTSLGVKNISTTATSTEAGSSALATASLNVVGPPVITESFGSSVIALNSSTSLSFTIQNNNPTALTGVGFTDTLPTGLVVATPNALSNTCGGAPSATAGSGSFSLSGGTVAGSSSCTITVNVTGTATGLLNNSSSNVTSNEGGAGGIAVASVTVTSGTYTVPTTPVGTTSSTQTATIGFSSSFTVGSIQVVTQGATGLDFKFVSGGSCNVGSTYSATIPCSVNFSFTPTAPGMRLGAILIYDNSATPVLESTSYLSGTGTGGLAAVSPGMLSLIGGGGSTTPTTTPIPAASASLSGPTDTVTDAAGNVYIADWAANLIEEISASTGKLKIIAGGGSTVPTTTPIAGTAANINEPEKIALDGAGNLYITEEATGHLDRLNLASGKVVLAAGGGGSTVTTTPIAATSAKFVYLYNLAVDGAGNVYFADYKTNIVVELSPSANTVVLVAGGGATSVTSTPVAATSAKFLSIQGLAVDGSENLFIADSGNDVIDELIASTGKVVLLAGTPSAGAVVQCGAAGKNPCVSYTPQTASGVQLNQPAGLALDPAGDVFFTDINNASTGIVDEFVPSAGTIVQVAGGGSVTASTTPIAASKVNIGFVLNIALDGAGNLYLADPINATVDEIGVSSGALTFPTATQAGSLDTVDDPLSVTVSNIGNTNLIITKPSSGTNPNLTGAYSFDSATTCTPLTVSSSAASIGSDTTCVYAVDFRPTAGGNNAGTLALTTNNGTSTSTDTIPLNGTGIATGPTLTITPGASAIPFLGSTSLTFALNNPNSISSQSNVSFSLVLPVGLTIAGTPSLSNTCGGTATALGGTTTIQLSGATMAPSASCAVSLNVTGSSVGVVNLSLAASSTTFGAGNTATATVTVVGSPILSESFGAATVALKGSPVTLSFTIQNPNTTVALTGVGFANSFPAGLVVATPNGLANTCGGTPTATAGSSSLLLSGATVAASSSCTITINVAATTTGLLNNSSSNVTSNEGGNGGIAVASITATSTTYTAPTSPVATPTSTQTATIGFSSSFTLGSIQVVTQGATGLDFTFASGGTCHVGSVYSSSVPCTVDYTFDPTAPGARYGAILLYDNSATPVLEATIFLSGTGNAAMGVVYPGTQSQIASKLSLNNPFSVAVDAFGNAYVTDVNNSRVLKIPPTDPTCTTASDCISIASHIGLTGAWGVAVDGAGNVYIPNNGHILRVPPTDLTCATAGDCFNVGTGAGFTAPIGIAVDGSGNVYTADTFQSQAFFIPATDLTCSTSGDCIKIASGLSYAQGIAVDGNSNVYIADNNNNRVLYVPATDLKCSTSGDCLSIGTGLNHPYGVAVNANGDIFIADHNNNRIVREQSLGGGNYTQSVIVTNDVPANSSLSGPSGVAQAGNGNLYIVEQGSSRVLKLDVADPATLTFTTQTAVGALDTTAAEHPLSISLVNAGNQSLSIASAPNPTFPSGFLSNAATTCLASSSLVAGASCTVAVDFKPTAKGVNSGSVVLTDNNLGVSGATQTLANLSGTGLLTGPQLAITPGASAIPFLGSTSLTFSITNTNPSAPLSGISFSLVLPVGLTIANTPSLSNTCGGTATAAGGTTTIQLSGGSLAANASCAVSLNVTGTSPGVANISLAASDVTAGTGNTAVASITVVAPPILSESFGAPSIAIGGVPTTLTLNIQNSNSTATLSGVGFTDSLPSGLSIATPNGLTNSCGGIVTAAAASGSITLSAGTLPVSASCAVVVNVIGTSLGLQNNSTGNVTSNEGGTGGIAVASITVINTPVFTVTSLIDDNPANAANCTNQVLSGATLDANCSLRDALAASALLSSPTITPIVNFAPSLTSGGPATLTLGNGGPLSINDSVNLTGPGANLLSINGGGTNQIVNVGSLGTTTISGVTLTNGSGTNGGAVSNAGNLTLINDVISGSTASSNGGGVSNTGTLTVTNTTISGNTGTALGGGIYNNGGTLSVTNSTIAKNSSPSGSGGGIYSTVTFGLIDSTVTQNTAKVGGGIDLTGGSLALKNDIDTGNTATVNGPDIAGSYSNGGGNLLGSSAGTGTSTSPDLAPLGNYGGTTPTMPALPGSSAICAGTTGNASGLTTDQRGNPRTTNAYSSTVCVDSGAVQTAYSFQFVQQPTNVEFNNPITPAPTVQLYDNGAAISLPGAPVTAAATAGTLNGTTAQTTSTGGLATFSNLSIAAAETGDQLTVTAPAGPYTFSATSSPFNVLTVTQLNFSASPSTPIVAGGNAGSAVAVQELDPFGNPVTSANDTITVTVTGPGGYSQTYTQAAVAGVATFNLSGAALTQAGGYTYTASIAAIPTVTTAVANETVNAGAPKATVRNSGSIQSQPIGVPFATQLSITVYDQYNNPVPNVTVTFAAPASGASASFTPSATPTTDSTGTVSVAATANATAGGPYNATASVSGVVSAINFSLTNLQGTPAVILNLPSPAPPITYGQSVTSLSAKVLYPVGAPTGTITFKDSGATLGTGNLSSSAPYTATLPSPGYLTAGNHGLSASYSGDSNFNSTSTLASSVYTVNQSSVTLSASTAQTVPALSTTSTISLTITGQYSGTGILVPGSGGGATVSCNFYSGVNLLATTTATVVPGTTSSTASCPVPSSVTSSGGSYTVTASFNGDGNYSATGPGTGGSPGTGLSFGFKVMPVTPAITWSPAAGNLTVVYGGSLSGVLPVALPTYNGSTVAGSYAYSASGVSGTVTAATLLPVGTYTITATFTPSNLVNYTTATAQVTFKVNPATPAIVTAPTANPVWLGSTITYTATVTGVAGGLADTGSVTFYDGTTALGTVAVNGSGVATITETLATSGAHSITATVAADPNYTTKTSVAISEVAVDFTVALQSGAPNLANVLPGQTATYNLVITPVGATTFPGIANLTLAGTPSNSTGTLSVTSVASGASATNFTLTVATTTALVKNDIQPESLGRKLAPLSLALFLLPLAGLRRGRKMWQRMLMVLVLLVGGLAATTGLSGCNLPSGYLGQSPKTFTLTVTGTAATLPSLTHNTSVTLTIE